MSNDYVLTFGQIYKYIGLKETDTDRRIRCVEEGERILNSQRFLVFGLLEKSAKKLVVFALCRSSVTQSKHQEIKVVIDNKKNIAAHCSCLAGNSAKCKHILAALLKLQREPIESLEDLSCTSITKQWGRLKRRENDEDQYPTEPFNTFCHGRIPEKVQCTSIKFLKGRNTTPMNDNTTNASELPNLIESTRSPLSVIDQINNTSNKTSVFNKNKKNKRRVKERNKTYATFQQSGPPPNHPLIVYADYSLIYGIIENIRIPFLEIEDYLSSLSDQQRQFYENKYVLITNEASQLCINTYDQKCELWKKARKARITGDKCYELYTFSNTPKDCIKWNNKISKCVDNSFKGNKNIDYGNCYEPFARNKYCDETGFTVYQFGIIVIPDAPWFGFSPDGILLDRKKLIEIKSPIVGENLSAKDCLTTLPYITVDENGCYKLKQKHKYYGQVQLGMALLNLSSCDFIIYASYDNSIHIINVEYDKKFAKKLLSKLTYVFFQYFIPFLSVQPMDF